MKEQIPNNKKVEDALKKLEASGGAYGASAIKGIDDIDVVKDHKEVPLRPISFD